MVQLFLVKDVKIAYLHGREEMWLHVRGTLGGRIPTSRVSRPGSKKSWLPRRTNKSATSMIPTSSSIFTHPAYLLKTNNHGLPTLYPPPTASTLNTTPHFIAHPPHILARQPHPPQTLLLHPPLPHNHNPRLHNHDPPSGNNDASPTRLPRRTKSPQTDIATAAQSTGDERCMCESGHHEAEETEFGGEEGREG